MSQSFRLTANQSTFDIFSYLTAENIFDAHFGQLYNELDFRNTMHNLGNDKYTNFLKRRL